MDIVQVATGLITIPPNGWGAVERIIWEYKNSLEDLGMNVSIKYPNEVEKRDNQIVHCHMANTAIEMRDRDIPYIYSLHDHHAEYYGKGSGVYNINLEAIKGSVISICPSEHIVDYFSETDKLFYVPHGVNTDFFKPSNAVIEDHRLLMIANNGLAGDSTIDRKGFRYGIEAAKRLNLPITIAGPENNKAFFEGHKDLLDYDKLTLMLTNPSDLLTLELYQSHTIFLAPSFLEYGHPNLSILEAMSCGLPIVGSSNVTLPGMYNLPENTTQAVVTGIQFTCGNYPRARQEQLDNRINHDWLVICRERLQKMYNAISIIGQKWTSEDTTQAYINTYAGI
jgi:glycosyltransferase involved in cell wall biosynthesis